MPSNQADRQASLQIPAAGKTLKSEFLLKHFKYILKLLISGRRQVIFNWTMQNYWGGGMGQNLQLTEIKIFLY